jgi:hypothetical protein
MHPSSLTVLAYYLNGALDSGKHNNVTLDEVYEQIEAGTVFEYLKNTVARIDLSGFSVADKQELVEEWQRMANAIDARRKLVVENNGICLLLAYVINGLHERYEKLTG